MDSGLGRPGDGAAGPDGDGRASAGAAATAGEAGDPVAGPAGGPARDLPWRAIAVYALLGAAALFILLRNLGSTNDFDNFLPFGAAALAGLNPYTPEMVELFGSGPLWSTWPPSFAPLAAALARMEALLGWPVTVVLWQAAGLGAVALVLAVYARWLYGRGLALRPGPDRLPLHTFAALAGLAVPARVVLSNFEYNQVHAIVLGLAVAGLWLLRTGRRWTGGLAVGLSTAFKAVPLLLLPYLAWRGRWKDAAAGAAGCAVAGALLPALLLGPADTAEWYRSWWAFVGDLPFPFVHTNQSLQGTLTRLLAPAAGDGHVFGAGPLGGHGAPRLVLLGALVLGLAGAAAFGRPGRSVGAGREALEIGVVFAAMALFAPTGWKYHYAVLLPLAAALWARTPAAARWAPDGSPPPGGPLGRGADDEVRPDGGGREVRTLPAGSGSARVLYGGLGAAALALNGTATGLMGNAAADRFEHWGVVTWSGLVLVLLALWLLWRERPRPGARGRAGRRHPPVGP